MTKLALFAANAEVDGMAIKLNQAKAMIRARVAFLMQTDLSRAEPNENAKLCIIWNILLAIMARIIYDN